MKIDVALRETQDAKTGLSTELLRVGERHKTDHDVYHLTRTLSGRADRHVHRLDDSDLLKTVTACPPETIRTVKWTVQKLKDSSPQVLAS